MTALIILRATRLGDYRGALFFALFLPVAYVAPDIIRALPAPGEILKALGVW